MHRAAEWHEKRALRLADKVFALSPYTADSLKGMVDPARLSVAYCGIDTELFAPDDPSGRPDDGEHGYILCVARLSDARKNVAMLLRAYASLLRKGEAMPDLYLAGESLSAEGQRLASDLGIENRVRAVGMCHGQQLADLYRGAKVFVLPSDEEGLGIVVLEAMASGVPVISTASGGPQAMIDDGKTGLLTSVSDQGALEIALSRLLHDEPFRRSLAKAGMETARTRFSMASTGAAFLEQYADLDMQSRTGLSRAASVA